MKADPGGFPEMSDDCGLIDTDTWGSSGIIFIAPTGNAKGTLYEWRVGNDTTVFKAARFSLDFTEYLKKTGYNVHIPVQLTIRTPYSSCLDNPADTLIVVKRNLFLCDYNGIKSTVMFNIGYDSITKKYYGIPSKYEGYFKHEPSKKIILQFNSKVFSAVNIVNYIVGYEEKDTIRLFNNNPNLKIIECYNTKHKKYTYTNPESYDYKELYSVFTRYVEYYVDNLNGKSTLYLRRDFRVNGKDYVREFVGYKVN